MHMLVDAILTADSLSQSSKTQYMEKLATLTKLVGKPIDYIVDNPRSVIAALARRYPKPLTQRAFVAAVKAVFHHNQKLKAEKAAQWQLYTDYQAELSQAITDRYMAAEPSDKERHNWVPWPEIMRKEQELAVTEYGSQDHLLLAMYCLIEPLRQDFGAVRILVGKNPPNGAKRNYLVIAPDGSWGKLVLNQYKTAKKYGTFERDLPANLVAIIKASLLATPRAYLFVDETDRPYLKSNSFTQFSNRTLRRIFGKNLTVSLMRHSHISDTDFNASTPGELFEKSRNMAHSVAMQQLYRRKVEPVTLTVVKDQAPPPIPALAPALAAHQQALAVHQQALAVHQQAVPQQGVVLGPNGERFVTLTM
jgi:D-arabinose 5-phosphate isomerase GutQ